MKLGLISFFVIFCSMDVSYLFGTSNSDDKSFYGFSKEELNMASKSKSRRKVPLSIISVFHLYMLFSPRNALTQCFPCLTLPKRQMNCNGLTKLQLMLFPVTF